jgi:hypothetical protein
MNRLAVPIVAVALLTAACGGAVTLSGSTDQSLTVAGAARVNGGANAGSDITNRPNPPVHRDGRTQLKPVTPQNVAPAAPQPAFGAVTDRCGSGTGTNGAGNRAGTTSQPKHRPLPLCAPA